MTSQCNVIVVGLNIGEVGVSICSAWPWTKSIGSSWMVRGGTSGASAEDATGGTDRLISRLLEAAGLLLTDYIYINIYIYIYIYMCVCVYLIIRT